MSTKKKHDMLYCGCGVHEVGGIKRMRLSNLCLIRAINTGCRTSRLDRVTPARRRRRTELQRLWPSCGKLFYFINHWLKALTMRSSILAFMILGACTLSAWCKPIKSIFVTFPGDVINNMTDKQLAEVSIAWLLSFLQINTNVYSTILKKKKMLVPLTVTC